jgi:hypothetical protein
MMGIGLVTTADSPRLHGDNVANSGCQTKSLAIGQV